MRQYHEQQNQGQINDEQQNQGQINHEQNNVQRTESLLDVYDSIRKGEVIGVSDYLRRNGNPNVAISKNHSHQYDFTLLGVACEFAQTEIVRLLLESGANPTMLSYNAPGYAISEQNRACNHGATPLMICAYHAGEKSLEIAKYLVRFGARPDEFRKLTIEEFIKKPVPEEVPATSLFCASISGSVQMAQFLLERGANINQQDLYGRTPLHKAAIRQDITMVRFFIENSADVSIKDYKDKKAMEYLNVELLENTKSHQNTFRKSTEHSSSKHKVSVAIETLEDVKQTVPISILKKENGKNHAHKKSVQWEKK